MYIVKLVLLKVLLLTKHIKTTGIKSLLYVISIVNNTKERYRYRKVVAHFFDIFV